MALRTVEPKKRTLHTQNKQIRRSGVSNGIPPGSTPGQTDGQMPNASGRFIMPEDKQDSQKPKDGENRSGKRRASGKVLHTAVRSGMDAVNNHVEGGEELRESEQILMAMGAAGKKVFRTRRQRQMNRAGSASDGREYSGTASAKIRPSEKTYGQTSTPGERTKDKQRKDRKNSKKRLRERQQANKKRSRYRRYLRRRRKRYEDDDKEEATPIGIKERLIHGFRVRDSEEENEEDEDLMSEDE